VIVIPDDNNIKVFSRGIAHGFKGTIPCGGQLLPISTFGDKLECR
jgi:hypothetical protein